MQQLGPYDKPPTAADVHAHLVTLGLMTPHLPRGVDHKLQLALLIVWAEQVPDHVGGEAALRADGELVK